jgi:hypothetical protein
MEASLFAGARALIQFPLLILAHFPSERGRRRLLNLKLALARRYARLQAEQKLRRQSAAPCKRESGTGRKRRGLAYLVLWLAFLQPQRAAAGQNAQGPSLTVLVFNYAEVSHVTLERAERQVEGIFLMVVFG